MAIQSPIIKFSLILSITLVLFSCGGGGSQVAEGGISGTGITMGRITNFGSVFVNGVEFNTDNATFLRDNQTASGGQNDFHVGEFVVVNGTVDASGITGTAFDVIFNDLLEGAVTQVSTPQGTSIKVLGQVVDTDLLTVFQGFSRLTDLQLGNIVEVSGTRNSSGLITATSISLKQTQFIPNQSENELKGIITPPVTSQTFNIGGLTVDYSNATGVPAQGLSSGQFVEVKSNTNVTGNNILFADSIKLENEFLSLQGVTQAEIEGQVTSFQSPTQFSVNGIPVTTTPQTQYKNGSANNLALNVFLEVEGGVDAAGVLTASKVAFEFENSVGGGELEGSVASINLAANELVVNGQIILLDTSTLMVDDSNLKVSPLTINDLGIGDTVDVEGVTQPDGRILASKLERSSVGV